MAAASFRVTQDDQGRHHVQLFGQWSLRAPFNDFAKLKKSLQPFFADNFTKWDLLEVDQLDAAGAATLLSSWGNKLNDNISIKSEHAELFNTLIGLTKKTDKKARADWLSPLNSLGKGVIQLMHHFAEFSRLLVSLLLEIAYLFRQPQDFPWREFV